MKKGILLFLMVLFISNVAFSGSNLGFETVLSGAAFDTNGEVDLSDPQDYDIVVKGSFFINLELTSDHFGVGAGWGIFGLEQQSHNGESTMGISGIPVTDFSVFANYHLAGESFFDPYFGGGYHFMEYYEDWDNGISIPGTGPQFQAGLNLNFSEDFFAGIKYSYSMITLDIDGYGYSEPDFNYSQISFLIGF